MSSTIVALLLIGYVPGALIFRLPVAARERRAALAADERAFWAVVLSLTVSLVVTFALALVGQYRFERLLLANGVWSAIVALAGRARLSFQGGAPRPTLAALVPVAVVAFGWQWYLPPAEYVLGGKDPGAYVSAGIQIAQRGAIVIDDPVVASVPPATRDLFFPPHGQSTYYSLRFMGFFVLDPRAGSVISQFPHLYPASIAIGYGLNGLSGARQTSVAWAVLGLLGVYFLAARLAGRTVAAGAVALLAIHVIEIWYARYPNAEVVMQALLWAAMLAGARALVDGDRFFGPLSGLLLGLLLFLRIDAVIAIGAVVAAAVLAWVTRRRIGPGFVVALAVSAGLASWYLFDLMAPYTALPIVFAQHLGPRALAGAAGGGVGFLLVAVLRRRVASLVETWVPRLGLAGLWGLAAYAYFFREPGGRLAVHDAMALRSFAWYVTGAGVFAALAGISVLAWKRFWHDPLFFTTAGVFSVFFFYKIRIVPEHFWMTRRFLPVILPATMIGLAALAGWACALAGQLRPVAPPEAAASPTRRAWLGTAVASALTLGVLALPGVVFWRASWPVAHHVEYAGLIPRLEQLAARLGDADLLVVESRAASDLHVIALPLAYIYARPTLVLASARPDRRAFESFLDWARTKYADVYFLGGGGTDLLSARVAAVPIASERFQVPEYESPVNAYPGGVRRKEFDFGLYRFVQPDAAPTGHLTLTIGELDDLNVVRFHAKEREAGTGQAFRWTQDVSYVSLVGLTEASESLTLWMSNGMRPAKAGPARVEVFLDEGQLGQVVVGSELAPYRFAIPVDLAAAASRRDAPARLKIVASTWNPQKLLGVPDPRDLGVRVMRVEVK